MKNKGKVNPVFIIVACIFILFRCLDVITGSVRLFQTGGASTVDALVEGYQDALNNGDAKAYLKLIPRSERTKEEKQHVKEMINEYSGNNYSMKVESSDSLGLRRIMSDNAKLILMDPLFCPIISEKQSVKVKIDKEDGIYYEMITVYKIFGRYYLDDVDVH